MRHPRRSPLGRARWWLAATWVVAQIGTLAAVPIALSITPPAAAAAEDCCPGAGPGYTCPMHRAPDGARACRIARACGNDAGLLSLVGIVGLPPRPTHTFVPAPARRHHEPGRAPVVSRASLPDPPPPRA